uniref:Heterogeneous nuclear ribonucleoprotein L n=1 Tax=Ascaris suum TaxID=6253 RepID=F1KVG6_ASCSU
MQLSSPTKFICVVTTGDRNHSLWRKQLFFACDLNCQSRWSAGNPIQMEDSEPSSKRCRKSDEVSTLNPEPSVVVHVRNLSSTTTEADLLDALCFFGEIAYVRCIPGKGMALVEFEEEDSARACITYTNNTQIYIMGQAALFNYSTSKKIQRVGLETEHASRVLILTVYNVCQPIDINVIFQICAPYGVVKRIAMLHRFGVQALVEFDDMQMAKNAKRGINGADIYHGCCTLKVEFAKPDHVNVTANTSMQWDYTTGLTPGFIDYPHTIQQSLAAASKGTFSLPTQPGVAHYGMAPCLNNTNSGLARDGCVVVIHGAHQSSFSCDKIFNLLCLYGNCYRIKFMKSKPNVCMVQMGSASEACAVVENLNGVTLFGYTLSLRQCSYDVIHEIPEPLPLPDGSPSYRDYSSSRNHRFTSAARAGRNKIVKPGPALYWFNAPSTISEETMKQLFVNKSAPVPHVVRIFPLKSDRSSNGICEFETTERSVEALALANHATVGPSGNLCENVIYGEVFFRCATRRQGCPSILSVFVVMRNLPS